MFKIIKWYLVKFRFQNFLACHLAILMDGDDSLFAYSSSLNTQSFYFGKGSEKKQENESEKQWKFCVLIHESKEAVKCNKR